MDKKATNKGKRYRVTALLCSIVFLCCAVWCVAYFVGVSRAERELEDIRDSYVEQGAEEASGSPEEQGEQETRKPTANGETGEASAEVQQPEAPEVSPADYGITDKTVDFEALQADVNEHIYAWITVPGTVIDYPVLQHPEETDYYLNRNLDGSKGYPGCIYTQNANAKDWSDPNTVLYGHNMKNGTMFSALHSFQDKKFFEENRYIHIYTEDGKILVYEIFGAYVFYNAHLLYAFPIQTDSGFQDYLNSIFENTGDGCNFLEDRELTSSDRIITLSTCISGQADKRYLVQGVLVDEVEQQ